MPLTPELQSALAGTKVLVVDDHTDTVMFLARLLQKVGCTVTTATGMQDAEARLSSEAFHLLISDLGLPDGSGIELMRRARQRHPIAGIALSGFDSADECRQCQEAGFCEHLVKPVDMARLLQAMQRALGA